MNNSLKVFGASVAGLAVGALAGYKVAEKRLAAIFEERLENETASMKEFYTTIKKPYPTPEEAVAELIPEKEKIEDPRVKAQKVQYNKIVKEEGYEAEMDEAEAELAAAATPKNVFVEAHKDGLPYIISQDSYMANDPDHAQDTVTYYQTDDGYVVVDQRDIVLDNVNDILGTDFMTRFGEGSSDENAVHVRNEKLNMDFEIVRSERSYEQDVLGVDG